MLQKTRAVFGRQLSFLSLQLFELMVACGVDPEALQKKEQDPEADGMQETEAQLVPSHRVRAVLKTEDGLGAVQGTFRLLNCTGQPDQAFQGNEVSLADAALGCRVAIDTLTLGEKTFHNKNAAAAWKTGDVLVFEATDGSFESLDVRIDHQLAATPAQDEDVFFTVSRSNAATAASQTLLAAGMDGESAPSFRIRKTEFVGLTAAGAGQFVFHLDCLKAIKPAEGELPLCNGIPLSAIHYQLVKDDYNSSLSYDEADALFQGNPGLTVDPVRDFEPFVAARKQAGGFVTQTGPSVLEGPPLIHENPHMLLILQGPGPSYQYFNVDVVFTSN